jgi:hypothetical protein
MPNGRKIASSIARPSKIYPNWDFGSKIYHLATLYIATKASGKMYQLQDKVYLNT